MKPRIKPMSWNVRKQKKTQPIRTTRREKISKEGSISSLWDGFKRSNIHIIQVPEEEEKEQEIGNIFEKIMKENFLNLVKEIRQASPGSIESQTRWCKEAYPKTHHN